MGIRESCTYTTHSCAFKTAAAHAGPLPLSRPSSILGIHAGTCVMHTLSESGRSCCLRQDGGSGRLLMEVLPRDEWTSRNYNEEALSARVQQLSYMRQMSVAYTTPGMLGSVQRHSQAQAREIEREQKRAQQLESTRQVGSDAESLCSSTVRFAQDEAASAGTEAMLTDKTDLTVDVEDTDISPADTTATGIAKICGSSGAARTVDKAAMIAAKILERCKEPAEVSALLEILETEPREHWATLLARRQY